MICPADLCDIFECPEFSEKILKFQTYTQRTDGNYEGKIDLRDGTSKSSRRRNSNTNEKLAPFRYEMI